MSSCSIWSVSASNRDVWAAFDGDGAPRVEPGDALDQRHDPYRPRARGRQPGQLGVGGHEAAQRLGPGRDHAQAAPQIRLPVVGPRLALHQAAEAAGDRLDRRQGVVQFVAEDADQALPRGAFLVAERLADVGEHDEVMGQAALAEGRVPHLPPAGRAGQRNRLDARPAGVEPVVHLELGGVAIEEPLRGRPEQPLAGVVHQLQAAPLVEGEDGDVELGHDLAQQGGRFERVEALPAQHLGERVDLGVQVVERIGAARAAGPDREVAFAKRREQVGNRLQRHDDPRPHRGEEAEGEHSERDRQRPLGARMMVARPQQDEGDEGARRDRAEPEQDEPLIVGEARPRRRHRPTPRPIRRRRIGLELVASLTAPVLRTSPLRSTHSP